MANLNEMRELKNVVEQIMSDENLARSIYKEANELLDTKLHNAGCDAIRGKYDSTHINKARAAMYLNDLIHSIVSYMEDGNNFSITMDEVLYPNAEKPDWATEED